MRRFLQTARVLTTPVHLDAPNPHRQTAGDDLLLREGGFSQTLKNFVRAPSCVAVHTA
jgi:hypothetical protein